MTCDRCHETACDDTTCSPAARGKCSARLKKSRALTDFQLPLYPLHVAVSVLGLDGVTVTHQLHKLSGQDAVLGERKNILVTMFHFEYSRLESKNKVRLSGRCG